MSKKSKFLAYGPDRQAVETVMRLHSVKRWHMIDTTRQQTLADAQRQHAIERGAFLRRAAHEKRDTVRLRDREQRGRQFAPHDREVIGERLTAEGLERVEVVAGVGARLLEQFASELAVGGKAGLVRGGLRSRRLALALLTALAVGQRSV